MRVRARVSRYLWPGAEVQRQQLPPWIDRVQIQIRRACVLQRPRQVIAEIVRSTQHAIGSRSRLHHQHLPQYLVPAFLGHHVVKHPKNIRLLAEVLLVRCVGKQPAFAAPALPVKPASHMLGAHLVALRPQRIAQPFLQRRRIFQRPQVFKRRRARLTLRVISWNRPRRNPIHEAPPRKLLQQPVRLLVFGKPIHHRARSRNRRLRRPRIGSVHPVVPHHPHPQQRKRRNRLRQRARIAAPRNPIREPRVIKRLQRLPCQPIVPRHGVRNQSLYPRVAYILQLLVIRRVHVSLMRIQPRRPPTDLPNLLQLLVVRLERRPLLKWISRKLRRQRIQCQRFARRLNI